MPERKFDGFVTQRVDRVPRESNGRSLASPAAEKREQAEAAEERGGGLGNDSEVSAAATIGNDVNIQASTAAEPSTVIFSPPRP